MFCYFQIPILVAVVMILFNNRKVNLRKLFALFYQHILVANVDVKTPEALQRGHQGTLKMKNRENNYISVNINDKNY